LEDIIAVNLDHYRLDPDCKHGLYRVRIIFRGGLPRVAAMAAA
jgi:hypothetical protein